MLIQIVHGVMVIIVDMHMHALQFKKTQLLVFQKEPVDELLTEYSSFLEKALLSCGTNFLGEEQNFQKKNFPGTKIFTENFVPPEQFFPDQNSSDRTLVEGNHDYRAFNEA